MGASEWFIPDALLAGHGREDFRAREARERREVIAWMHEYGVQGGPDCTDVSHHTLAPGAWIPVVSYLFSRPRNLPMLDDMERR